MSLGSRCGVFCFLPFVVDAFIAGSLKERDDAGRLGGRTATCSEAGAKRSWLSDDEMR